MTERGGYRRSRGADPVATVGALLLGLGTVGAFAFMQPTFGPKAKREPTVVRLLDLPDDPPPAAEVPPPPKPDAPPPPPAVTAPAPLVSLPLPSAIPAPPPPPQPAPAVARPAPAAAPGPVIARAPENLGDLSAQIVFRRPIHVPHESRRQHEEGIVVLALLLDRDGRVASIDIASSSGFPRLDQAALESVRDWRWSPLVRNGEPVSVRGTLRIPFIRERGGPGGHPGRGRRHGRDDRERPAPPGGDDRT